MNNPLIDLLGQDDFVFIPREHIFPNPANDRTDWDSPERIEHVQSLAASFVSIVDGKQFGCREPLKVRKVSHQRYEIISGESRWRAANLAELAKLPCIVTEKNESSTQSLEALIINFLRNNLSPWELAHALQKRIDGEPDRGVPPMSLDELSKILNRSKPWISKYTAVLKMPDAIQALCRDGLVENIDTLRTIAALDEEERGQAISAVRDGTNANELARDHRKTKLPKEKSSSTNQRPNAGGGSSELENEFISLKMNRDQAIHLLSRLGISPNETDTDSLRNQLMAQITGVDTDGGTSTHPTQI